MAKVTDQLLAMAAAAGRGERDKALEICRSLRERHYLTAGELLGTGLHTDLHNELGAEFDSLDELLRGISAVGELTPRTSDYVVSFGERLSSMIVDACVSWRATFPPSLRRSRDKSSSPTRSIAAPCRRSTRSTTACKIMCSR